MKLYTKDGVTVQVYTDAEEEKFVKAGYELVGTANDAFAATSRNDIGGVRADVIREEDDKLDEDARVKTLTPAEAKAEKAAEAKADKVEAAELKAEKAADAKAAKRGG